MQIIDPFSNVVDQGDPFLELPISRLYKLPEVPVVLPRQNNPRNTVFSVLNKSDWLHNIFMGETLQQIQLAGKRGRSSCIIVATAEC